MKALLTYLVGLTISQGRLAGQPFEVLPWQRRFIRGAFRRACADGRVIPSPSLLLRSAMFEARTVSDPAGNAKLSKGSQDGRRLRARFELDGWR